MSRIRPIPPVGELFLIRHCETEMTCQRRYGGWADSPLSSAGRRCAERMANWLPTRLPRDARLWSSDLTRAMETAALCLPGRLPRKEPRIREMNFGDFTGNTFQENTARFGKVFSDWVEDPSAHPPPRGESLQVFEDRISFWLDDLQGAGTSAAVTHGGVMRAILARHLHQPILSTFRYALPPGSVVRIPVFGSGEPAWEMWRPGEFHLQHDFHSGESR
ncbi:MAG: histidine phosphatase family protein [Gemmatimonadota bacterium]